MQIKLKVTVAGRGFALRPGTYQVPADLSEDRAKDLVAAGHAVEVKERTSKKAEQREGAEE
jgi:hypothetical protein